MLKHRLKNNIGDSEHTVTNSKYELTDNKMSRTPTIKAHIQQRVVEQVPEYGGAQAFVQAGDALLPQQHAR
jgi:hypothetical protein